MPRQFFISDLHLDDIARPETVALFLRFLEETPRPGDRLFILGDLFEVWIGDADDGPLARAVRDALRACSDRGVRIALQRGNRDFLLGGRFARATGTRILPATYLTEVAGQPTLLLHGDLLCTDDRGYQVLRMLLQNPLARLASLLLGKERCNRIGARLRRASHSAKARKPAQIMDANTATVERYLQRFGVRRMIHGHTHRPARHLHRLADGSDAERYVLDEWHRDRASALVDDGTTLATVAIK